MVPSTQSFAPPRQLLQHQQPMSNVISRLQALRTRLEGMHLRTISVRRTVGCWYSIHLPYKPGPTQEFNKSIRDTIPLRVFDPSIKAFYVHETFCALYLLEAARFDIITHAQAVEAIDLVEGDRKANESIVTASLESDYAQLGLLPRPGEVPFAFIEYVYHFWLQRFHNMTGSAEYMESMRLAFMRIKESFEAPDRVKTVIAVAQARQPPEPGEDIPF